MLQRTGDRKTGNKHNPHETFVLLKPDGVKKQLLVELLLCLRINKLRVVNLHTVKLSEPSVAFLYGQHWRRPTYRPMCKWLQSGSCMVLHVAGRNAVSRVRKLMGTGNWPYPKRSFRGTYATTQWRNVMHASDSPECAKKELGYFFEES